LRPRIGILLRFGAKLPDRAQHPQPVSKRYTDVLEVLIAQLGQDVGVDRVFSK
jgi:hypothetical protein